MTRLDNDVNYRMPTWQGSFFDGYGVPLGEERLEFHETGEIAAPQKLDDTTKVQGGTSTRGLDFHEYIGDYAYMVRLLVKAREIYDRQPKDSFGMKPGIVGRINLDAGSYRMWYARTEMGDFWRLTTH